MPFYLEDGLSFIGVLRPGAYDYSTKVHAIVERERRPPRPYGSSSSIFYSMPREYHYALCGGARWYASIATLVRDGRIDRTEDTNTVTCKLCKKLLEKYLGKFDLNNPDWEI